MFSIGSAGAASAITLGAPTSAGLGQRKYRPRQTRHHPSLRRSDVIDVRAFLDRQPTLQLLLRLGFNRLTFLTSMADAVPADAAAFVRAVEAGTKVLPSLRSLHQWLIKNGRQGILSA